MPIIGMILKNGTLVKTADALATALRVGHIDGYPYAILNMLIQGGFHSVNPTASAIAGGALRRTVLEHILDFYVCPADRIPMMRGSLIHTGMEKAIPQTKELHVAEVRLSADIPGKYKGRKLSGKLDRLYIKEGRLIDYKTASRPPEVMYEAHVFQLAVYAWLARWSGYTINDIAIVYIGWNSVSYVDACELDGKLIRAIEHPLLTDEALFIEWVSYIWTTLKIGFTPDKEGRYLVPGRDECNTRWCQNCAVRWACDRILDVGGIIDPKDFMPEEYQ